MDIIIFIINTYLWIYPLNVKIFSPHGDTANWRTASEWLCTLDTPNNPWENIVCIICIAAILQAQYLIDSWIILKYKSITLPFQPMEDAVMQKTTLFLFHMNMFWLRTPGEVNSLSSLEVCSNWLIYILY